MTTMPSQMTGRPSPWNDLPTSAASAAHEDSNSETSPLVIDVTPVPELDAEIHNDLLLFQNSLTGVVLEQENTSQVSQSCLIRTEKDAERLSAADSDVLDRNQKTALNIIDLTLEGEAAEKTASTCVKDTTLDNSQNLMTGKDMDCHAVLATSDLCKVTVICPDSADEADTDDHPTVNSIPGINVTLGSLNPEPQSTSGTTMQKGTNGRLEGSEREGLIQSALTNKDSSGGESCSSETSQLPPESTVQDMSRQQLQSGQSFNSLGHSEVQGLGNNQSDGGSVAAEKTSNTTPNQENRGADRTENCMENTLDSTLIAYLTNFPSRMQSVGTDPTPQSSPTSALSSVSHQGAMNSTSINDSVNLNSSAMMSCLALTNMVALASLETAQPNQDFGLITLQETPPPEDTSDSQMTIQTNRQKRKHSSASVIPIHVKEEKVDDSYETTPQPATKVQVLAASDGQRSVISRSQLPVVPHSTVVQKLTGNPSRFSNLQQLIVASSASAANALPPGRPRTVPAYRFSHFRTLVPKNFTPSAVANGSSSLARFIASNTQNASRQNSSVHQGYPPPVTTAPLNPRSLIRHSRWTTSSTIQSKTILTPAQSPCFILVNRQNPGTSQISVAASTSAHYTIPASVPQSSSRTNSDIASLGGAKTVRPLKVRPSNTNAALLTRKFEQLYKKSILPKFLSPKLMPDSLHVSAPLKMLACEGCGDEFLTERGLSDHYERKSIVISFTCRCDKKAMLFYNMCSFARFYDRHTGNNTSLHSFKHHSSYDSCVMAMLPPYLMPLEYHRLVAEDEKKKKQAEAAVPASSTTNARALSSTQAALPVSRVTTVAEPPRLSVASIKEFFNVLESLNVNCQECPAVYKRRKGLVAHMSSQRSSPKSDLYKCNKCFMVLPNACSFRAHTRIHDKLEPYVCPECGQTFRTSRDIFMKHVKKVCLHFSRFQSRQCPVCSTTLSHSEETMVAHLENAHAALYHKCNSCTMAFPTEKSFRSHSMIQHSQAATSKTFRKCPICNATEKEPQSLSTHLGQHVSKDGFGPLCFFRCLFCLTSFATRSDLVDHTRNAHPSEMIAGHICEICGAVCENGLAFFSHTKAEHKDFLTQLLNANTGKTPSDVAQTGIAVVSTEAEPTTAPDTEAGTQPKQKSLECDRCQMVLSDDEQFKRHVAKHRFLEAKRTGAKLSKKKKHVDESSVTSESVQIKSEQVTDEVSATSKSDQPTPVQLSGSALSCPKAVEMENESKGSKDAILSWFSCHLCEKTFKNTDDLQLHLKDTHTGKSRLHAYLCWICREQSELKSYPKAGMLIKHLKNFHKIARKNIDYARIVAFNNKDNESTTGDDEKPIKCDASLVRNLRVEGDTTYNCAKCDFSSSERGVFHEHIAKHCLKGSHQCLECGISFVALPSLKRHLFVVHRVRDFTRYQNETGLSLELPAVADHDSDPDDFFMSPNTSSRLSNADAESSIQSDDPITTSPEKDSTSTLECTVCYRSFADQCTLRQHMRVHGMAFIQGTRRSNMSRKSTSSDS